NNARDAAAERKAEIEQIQADMEQLSTELEERQSEYQDQLAEVEQDQEQIASEIARIDEENRRREEARRRAEERRQQQLQQQQQQQQSAPSGGGGSASGGSSGGGGGSSSSIAPPVSPLYVTSPYGYRVYPITGGWFMHNGVDLRSSCGEAQGAAASGTVSAVRGAYGNGTHGNQVMINHGMINGSSWVTVYNHLSGFAVSEGQTVTQGQTIGYTGATGAVTGCHVHFEVWKNGSTIDPMTL